ncbi:aminotransferase class I/II-fold pyridoxal phosphate-dependent enzyme [Salegentibacter sp. JZCK2]|uniref:trans-sulfuration enzyme family protein n=1 Tax=Salegentibacter tibetensis TaxID=2873600 RepID=UPI001CC93AEE|nr:aminotransferase class I/II-fold pyridoxal phosphate-dependent enzyme [Salegentibacter tibetensis]MBZ9731582.1 aminotransferase class I/II-fold pyridoxal phosphate-dependent enzyme [Salegentibacter tibetensis]
MYSKETDCVHNQQKHQGVNTPIYTSTANRYIGYNEILYPRNFNTENQKAIVDKLCRLEKGDAGMIFSSGTAAISTVLFSFLKAGDHALFSQEIYGGTAKLIVEEFPKYNIDFDFIPNDEIGRLDCLIRENTKVIYTETPSNPLLSIVDLEVISAVARKNNIISVVDNTFATPIIQNPISMGFDIVVHSGTKYLGGHHDLCFGAIVTSHKLNDIIYQSALNFGGSLNGLDCYLIERSLKTLALRVEKQSSNALKLAKALQENSEISAVYYPGLESHPNHTVAASQMKGGFGGMLSFKLKDDSKTEEFLNRLQLVIPALSLGGLETTICQPSTSSHASLSEEERLEQGITDALLRLSVGIEDADDLRRDILAAIASS